MYNVIYNINLDTAEYYLKKGSRITIFYHIEN